MVGMEALKMQGVKMTDHFSCRIRVGKIQVI